MIDATDISSPAVSVVLPVYMNEEALPELYERLVNTLSSTVRDFELIFVVDGSPDDSWHVVENLARADSRVKAVNLSRNFGQHPAIAAGFERATGDVVVLMDADLQDRPEDIPRMTGELGDGIDIVYTVKNRAKEPFSIRLTSGIYHRTFSRLTRTKVPREIGTLRAFTRDYLNAILQYREYNVLYGPLMFFVGFQFAVVKVDRDSRRHGASAYHFAKRLALAVNSLLIYTDLPQRVLVRFGAIIFTGSVLYLFVNTIGYVFFAWQLPRGLNLIVFLVTMGLGINMLSIGIVGAYVFRVYQEVLRRPRYVVAREINCERRPR